MKCLIVDDEPLVLRDIHRTAQKVMGEDTEFFLVGNPIEAMKIVEDISSNPEGILEIAVIDIELLNSNGIDLAKKIQKIYPRINLIMVSGDGRYALETWEINVSDFIIKPVNGNRLQRAVDNLRYPVE